MINISALPAYGFAKGHRGLEGSGLQQQQQQQHDLDHLQVGSAFRRGCDCPTGSRINHAGFSIGWLAASDPLLGQTLDATRPIRGEAIACWDMTMQRTGADVKRAGRMLRIVSQCNHRGEDVNRLKMEQKMVSGQQEERSECVSESS